MIPADVVEFIHGPQIALIGTRDRALRPTSTRVIGAIAQAEDDLITAMIADVTATATLANLADNGRVALVMSEFPSHRTYQFKGSCVDIKRCSESQKAVRNLYLEKLGARIAQYLWVQPPADYYERVIIDPAHAIRFKVEAMFNQTPGPQAGAAVPFTPGR